MSFPFNNVKHSFEIITIGEYIEKYQPGLLLDLNPITQRPPIFLAVDNTKSIEIVQTALKVLSFSGNHLMVDIVNVLFMVTIIMNLL